LHSTTTTTSPASSATLSSSYAALSSSHYEITARFASRDVNTTTAAGGNSVASPLSTRENDTNGRHSLALPGLGITTVAAANTTTSGINGDESERQQSSKITAHGYPILERGHGRPQQITFGTKELEHQTLPPPPEGAQAVVSQDPELSPHILPYDNSDHDHDSSRMEQQLSSQDELEKEQKVAPDPLSFDPQHPLSPQTLSTFVGGSAASSTASAVPMSPQATVYSNDTCHH
jgi:hypothetical protein